MQLPMYDTVVPWSSTSSSFTIGEFMDNTIYFAYIFNMDSVQCVVIFFLFAACCSSSQCHLMLTIFRIHIWIFSPATSKYVFINTNQMRYNKNQKPYGNIVCVWFLHFKQRLNYCGCCGKLLQTLLCPSPRGYRYE